MNKLIFGLLTLLLIFPLFIYAQPGPSLDQCQLKHDFTHVITGCSKDATISADQASTSLCCVLDAMANVTDWIFYILSVVVALLAIYGAFVITTAAGDPNKVTSGRQILTFALIGLVVALVAKYLPYIVVFFLRGNQ